METIIRWVLVLALCAAVVFGIVHFYESWRNHVYGQGETAGKAEIQQAWDGDVKKRDKEKLLAIETAVAKSRADAAAVVQGERDARLKAEQSAEKAKADATVARRNNGGLLGTVEALNRAAGNVGVPSAAACPGEFAKQRESAVRARNMLAACSSEYRDMAEGTDRAWGDINLKLDTALSYVNTVAPR